MNKCGLCIGRIERLSPHQETPYKDQSLVYSSTRKNVNAQVGQPLGSSATVRKPRLVLDSMTLLRWRLFCTRPNFPYSKVYALAYLHRLSSHKKEKQLSRRKPFQAGTLYPLHPGIFPKKHSPSAIHGLRGTPRRYPQSQRTQETVRGRRWMDG